MGAGLPTQLQPCGDPPGAWRRRSHFHRQAAAPEATNRHRTPSGDVGPWEVGGRGRRSTGLGAGPGRCGRAAGIVHPQQEKVPEAASTGNSQRLRRCENRSCMSSGTFGGTRACDKCIRGGAQGKVWVGASFGALQPGLARPGDRARQEGPGRREPCGARTAVPHGLGKVPLHRPSLCAARLGRQLGFKPGLVSVGSKRRVSRERSPTARSGP